MPVLKAKSLQIEKLKNENCKLNIALSELSPGAIFLDR